MLNTISSHTFLTRKRSYVYCVVAFLINSVIVYATAYLASKYISIPMLKNYVLALIAFLYIGYIYFVFKESFSKKIFSMFSVWIFAFITQYVAITIIKAIPSIASGNLQLTFYLIRYAQHILFIAASFLWFSKPYKRIIGNVSDRTISFMSLYLILTFLLLFNNYDSSFTNLRNFDYIFDMLLFLGFIILSYVVVFAGISSSSKTISLKYKYKMIENQVELQRQNYKTLNESLEHLYALKHDVRHHISAIETMVGQQKYKEALEYIEQFNQNQRSTTLPTLCNNFAADSIVKYYMSLALSKNIDFKVNLIIPEDISINPLDLCIVLGNCLENAIEACDKLSSESIKSIDLTSKIVGTHIIIKITNNFSGEIIKLDNIIKSTKDGNSHGIGLSNVNETVKKYNGNLDIYYLEDIFDITIIMCTCISSLEMI